jgi:NAD(P)-dependent dehydrogenase (short-subunit alcohol dehydrogenase family)
MKGLREQRRHGAMWATALEAVLDRSILFSFDRSGFERHARRFRAADLEVDYRGRICLVTGANSGIGFATAEGLARRGATVWLLCRDASRGRQALREIRRRVAGADVHLARLDVSDLGSVRAFAARSAPRRVDVLVHNAGVLPDQRALTVDGIETTLATNVIGPFLLTQLLWPRLTAAPDGRVIWISSGGMYATRLSLADPDWTARPFDGVAAYAQTKRMQVVLAEQMAARGAAAGVGVHSMHPGWADTPAVRSSLPRFHRWMRKRLRTPKQGADTVLWLALRPGTELPSGRFWLDRAPQPTHLLPLTREGDAEREALWAFCERRAGRSRAGAAERRSA